MEEFTLFLGAWAAVLALAMIVLFPNSGQDRSGDE